MTFTQEELNVELYKKQQIIEDLQEELKETQVKYHNVLETCLELKNELKRSNNYCDRLLHKKDMYKSMYLKEKNRK